MPDYHYYTALRNAAKNGHVKSVEFLLKSGADVNMGGTRGGPALIGAVSSGHENCVEALIQAGAEVNSMSRSKFGFTPITLAVDTGHMSILRTLVEAGADVNTEYESWGPVINKAVSHCYYYHLDFLLSAGADVNARSADGNTPLIAAATHNKYYGVNCVKVLLKNNALVNMINYQNMNALCSHISKCVDWGKPPDRTMVLLLYAAGESLDGIIIDEGNEYIMCVLDYLDKREIQLKELCREVIRQKLIKLYPHKHLFDKVTNLGLPPSLADYMLYNVSLEVSPEHGLSDRHD